MFGNFKSIKASTMTVHILITLGYPLFKLISEDESRQLLVFTDALTIIAFLLLVLGLLFSFSLKGDFDRTKFILMRTFSKSNKLEDAYYTDEKQKREDSFDYPLFLGLIYLIAAIVLSNTLF